MKQVKWKAFLKICLECGEPLEDELEELVCKKCQEILDGN